MDVFPWFSIAVLKITRGHPLNEKVWLKIAPFMEDLLGIQPPRVLVECWQLPSVQGFLDSTQHERHHTISAKQRTMMNNVTMTFKAGQLGFQRFLGSLDFKSWINQTLDSHREHKYQPQRPSAVLQHWSALMSGARRKRPSKKNIAMASRANCSSILENHHPLG